MWMVPHDPFVDVPYCYIYAFERETSREARLGEIKKERKGSRR